MISTDRITLSNIAWGESNDSAVLKALQDDGFSNLEVSPFKNSNDKAEIIADLTSLKTKGFNIVAFQSLMYRQPVESIFKSSKASDRILAHLVDVFEIAAGLGVTTVVFGSPKYKLRGLVSRENANIVAKQFFNRVAEAAKSHGVTFCIEATPDQYDADFITSTIEAIELVKSIKHQNLKINLDLGALMLNRDDVEATIESCREYTGHVHVSEPFLKPINTNPGSSFHHKIAKSLKSVNYTGYISVEMLASEDLSAPRIKEIMRFVASQYQIVYD